MQKECHCVGPGISSGLLDYFFGVLSLVYHVWKEHITTALLMRRCITAQPLTPVVCGCHADKILRGVNLHPTCFLFMSSGSPRVVYSTSLHGILS